MYLPLEEKNKIGFSETIDYFHSLRNLKREGFYFPNEFHLNHIKLTNGCDTSFQKHKWPQDMYTGKNTISTKHIYGYEKLTQKILVLLKHGID